MLAGLRKRSPGSTRKERELPPKRYWQRIRVFPPNPHLPAAHAIGSHADVAGDAGKYLVSVETDRIHPNRDQHPISALGCVSFEASRPRFHSRRPRHQERQPRVTSLAMFHAGHVARHGPADAWNCASCQSNVASMGRPRGRMSGCGIRPRL